MTIIQHRRGTTAEWAASSYILEAGEIGIEIDTSTNPDTVIGAKIGNGESLWSALDYVGSGGLPVGGTAGQIVAKIDSTDYNAEWIDNYTTDVRHTVINNTGSTLYKGQAVYISNAGNSSDTPRVALAQANAEATSSKTLGLLMQDLAQGESGFVIASGLLTGIDTSAASAGDAVWLSYDTAGGRVYVNPPSKATVGGPVHVVYLGVVGKSNANQGSIIVKIQNGYELDEIHDAYINAKTDKDLLAYESSTGLWKNKSFSTLGLIASSSTLNLSTSGTIKTTNTTASTSTTTGALTSSGGLGVAGSAYIGGNLTLTGDLTVNGTTTTVGTSNLVISDPMIYMGENNSSNLLDLGFVASFNNGTYQHSGLVRDASDGIWKLFSNVVPEPTTTVDFTSASYDTLKVGTLQVTDATTTRSNLGLVIGTNVQAYSATLAGITGTKVTNWDTAYGWGDHSAAGYLTTSSASSTYLTISSASSTYLAKTPTNLSNTEDLDALITPGYYYQALNANTDVSTRHYPVAQAGMLTVSAGGSMVFQTYQTYGTAGANRVYHRAKYNGAWATWRNDTDAADRYSGTSWTGSNALMVASATGVSAPTARPDGAALQAGDIWISW